jgi:Na+-transporting methylmalonyl-CoA/oxaloacetate decarboxylase gamma subunit
MDNLEIGLIITILGMVVTLLTLLILMLVIRLLTRIFPYKEEQDKKDN